MGELSAVRVPAHWSVVGKALRDSSHSTATNYIKRMHECECNLLIITALTLAPLPPPRPECRFIIIRRPESDNTGTVECKRAGHNNPRIRKYNLWATAQNTQPMDTIGSLSQ